MSEPKPLEELLADLRAHVSLGTAGTMGGSDTLLEMARRLRAVAKTHVRVAIGAGRPGCRECWVPWPCHTTRALAGEIE